MKCVGLARSVPFLSRLHAVKSEPPSSAAAAGGLALNVALLTCSGRTERTRRIGE
jgi:hypothetical protein